jgi:glucose-6-phosphate isomerase
LLLLLLLHSCCCSGNRPSTSLLLPELNAYTVGQLLALYEHQVAVQVREEEF